MKKCQANMIKLTEAANILGKPYGYLYFNIRNWVPVIDLRYIDGHYYCNKRLVLIVKEMLDSGYAPAWKCRGGKKAHSMLSNPDNINKIGVLWININSYNLKLAKKSLTENKAPLD